MQQINSTQELKEAILLLEIKQLEEARKIRDEFHHLYESLRPINLLKNSINSAIALPELKGNLLNLTLGHAAGFIGKKAFVRGSGNPVKNLLGNVLQFGLGNYIAKHPAGVKSAIMNGLQGVIHKITDRNSQKNAQDKLYYDVE
jgi:hypothetical protein